MSLILLAEDDTRLANLVKDYLSGHNFTVVVEHTGLTVGRRVKDLNPDIVVLDIMLPGRDGLTLCRELRDHYTGPILMLTARDSDGDQIRGLEVGADDYVIKPAEPRVLLARIRALLRRCQQEEPASETRVQLGRLSVDLQARLACLDKDELGLSSHEFDLLAALARQAGKVVSREYLFTTVYNRPYDGLDRTIDVRISHLRRKLRDDSHHPDVIKTVWGKGYMLVPTAWD
ncbi:response regulator transcription factor [Spongiibacter nanhainus]|uniref:Response regulator transcription factor n=1 Tax=Spongiibacter nanhainus TaxID=2794344 RepID=A0A7T4R0I1_9GAMM|nr:response regulator transcription factor [Spongiibacter nanhainus]QQD18176.1 response regulator transcription factor [Spongiibacter nanhainus]